MLLVVDIGNTTTRVGVWQDGAAAGVKVFPTGDACRTSQLTERLALNPEDVDLALCSVVPPATEGWVEWHQAAGRRSLVVRGDTDTPLTNRYRDPPRLGGDRLAAAVGAVRRFGAPVVVVSLGTATVVDAVSAQSEYLGGAIAVGVQTGLDALAEKTRALPRVSAAQAHSAIGEDTQECLLVGATYGMAALVEGLVGRLREVVGAGAPLVMTGGHAELISRCLRSEHEVVPTLTLEGVAAIWEHNCGEADADR